MAARKIDVKGWDDGVAVMKQQPLGLQNVGVVINGLTKDRYERANHVSCTTGSPQNHAPNRPCSRRTGSPQDEPA